MEKFDLVIVGSGFWSVGQALAAKGKKVLICEKSHFCEKDYAATFSGSKCAPYEPVTEEGKRLKEILVLNKSLTDEAFLPSGGEVALAQYIREAGVNLLLETVFVSQKESDGRKILTFFNVNGLWEAEAEKVLFSQVGGGQCVFRALFQKENGFTGAPFEWNGISFYWEEYFYPEWALLCGIFPEKSEVNEAKSRLYRAIVENISPEQAKLLMFAHLPGRREVPPHPLRRFEDALLGRCEK